MVTEDFTGVDVVFDSDQYLIGETMTITVSGQSAHVVGGVKSRRHRLSYREYFLPETEKGSLAGTMYTSAKTVTLHDVTIVEVTDPNREWEIAADGKNATAVA